MSNDYVRVSQDTKCELRASIVGLQFGSPFKPKRQPNRFLIFRKTVSTGSIVKLRLS